MIQQSVRCPVCGLFVRGLYGPGNVAPCPPHHEAVNGFYALPETMFTTTPICEGTGQYGIIATTEEDSDE